MVIGQTTSIMMSNLANALKNLNRMEEALPWAEKAAKARPNNGQSAQTLAIVKQALSKRKK